MGVLVGLRPTSTPFFFPSRRFPKTPVMLYIIQQYCIIINNGRDPIARACGLKILDILGQAQDGVSITELAETLGVDKGSASRLVATLVN